MGSEMCIRDSVSSSCSRAPRSATQGLSSFLVVLVFFHSSREACLFRVVLNESKQTHESWQFFSVFVTFFVTVIAALVLDFPVFHESWHLAVILRDILRQTRHFRET